MILAQISDLHLCADGALLAGFADTERLLAECVEHLNRMAPRPDVVVATGDLVNDGQPKQYALLRRLLDRLEMPVYPIPGNHDDRDAMGDAFRDMGVLPAGGFFLHYTIEDHAVRLIALDTLIPGADGGEMCAQRLRWLDDRLTEQPNRPTVVVMHHPPIPSGLAYMDKDEFRGGAEMAKIIRRHSQVEAILCGHLHRPVHVRWAGTMVSVAPSCVFQFVLDLADGAPHAIAGEPRACALYRWLPDTGLVGHLSNIGTPGI